MPEYVPLVLTFFGVVALLVAAVYVARSTINKETVKQQASLIEAQDQRLEFQEKRIDSLEAENERLQQRVEALEKTKNELFEQVKSIPAFASMASEMVALGKQMEQVLAALTLLADRIGAST